MLQTDAIQQSLVVLVLQTPGTQVAGDYFLDSLDAGLEIAGFAGTLFAPQSARLLQETFQFQSKAARSSGLGLEHFVDIAMEMVQAFLLFDPQQLFGLVTPAPVGDHDSRVVGRNQFPYLFVAMLAADLKYRRLVRVESRQLRAFPVNRPAGIVGVDHRCRGHPGPQPLVGLPDDPLRLL